jgi:hypothetical protein
MVGQKLLAGGEDGVNRRDGRSLNLLIRVPRNQAPKIRVERHGAGEGLVEIHTRMVAAARAGA